MIQKTLGIIKPDAVKRNLVGKILSDIQNTDLKLVGLKMLKLDSKTAEEFYKEHKERVFFSELVDFMTSSEIVVFALEGENAIAKYRKLMGETNPEESEEGTLRKKYAKSKAENSVHGSDSPEAAERELKIFNL
tara:strand:- start:12740 stop:13141 length:402 start_codon:yes stop_codon:yes gene_type:complete